MVKSRLLSREMTVGKCNQEGYRRYAENPKPAQLDIEIEIRPDEGIGRRRRGERGEEKSRSCCLKQKAPRERIRIAREARQSISGAELLLISTPGLGDEDHRVFLDRCLLAQIWRQERQRKIKLWGDGSVHLNEGLS